MPRIYIYPKKGDSFHVTLDKNKVSIGRSAENDIPIPDPFCSSKHAFIAPEGDQFHIQDNNSKNGVFLNGKRIQAPVPLKKGDEILMGSTRIVFDMKLDTKVEVTDEPSSSANINTIMRLKDVLRKPDISTTIRAEAKSLDIEAIRTEHKDLAIINEVSKALILHEPLDELVEHVMDLISEYLPMDRGVLMLKEGQPPQLREKVVRINNKQLMHQKIHVSQSIINTAIDQHSSILISDVQSDARFRAQDSILKMNIQSAMCVPLWNNKEIIGIIYADRISLLENFTDDDLRLLTLLSNLAAVKIENALIFEMQRDKERMDNQLRLARDIQQDLLPKASPECKDFEIVGTNIPCYQVGGDYYDFYEIDDERIGAVIADVSGKGVGPALLMAGLRAALRAEIHPEYDIEKMAAKLNDYIHSDTQTNTFISFFYLELNRKTAELKYINSGHNPPIVIDKKKKIQRLDPCGLCLGMFPSEKYEARSITLNPGDNVVLFTDGFTESRNTDNQEFQEEGLINLLKKHHKLTAEKLLKTICDEVNAFSAGTDPRDDMTLIIIKRNN